MTIWLDAHLSPALATWLSKTFGVDAVPIRNLNLRDAEDAVMFSAAKSSGAVVMTKDRDFLSLLERHGPPPQIIWVTVGNTSNARMRSVLTEAFPTAMEMLEGGEELVELGDGPPFLSS